jgi:predicted amidophosphoribosyltransferase
VLEWPLSRAVTLHEDAAELRLTPFLAQLASDAAGEWCGWARAVACVPASPGAYARRGFDHGALLGAAFARVTGVPAIDVLRALPRRDQRLLGRERGRANAGASLVAVPGAFVPARVLVLDDVMTTGATIESAAVALLEAGAAEVRVVAVARACSGNIWAPRSGSPPERRRSPRLPPASMKPLPPGSVVAGLATARPQSKVDAAERTHVSRRATVA